MSSHPILEKAEQLRVERNTRALENQVGGKLKGDTATAGQATPGEMNNPKAWAPSPTAGIPGFDEAAKESAANAPAPSFEQLGKLPENVANTAEQDANEIKKHVFGWAEALGKLLSNLLEASFWMRVLKFILGGGLIVIALVMFVAATSGGTGGKATPVTSATQAIKGPAGLAGKAARRGATAQRRRATRVSKGQRQRTQAAATRDRERNAPPARSTGTRKTTSRLTVVK